MSCPAGTSTTRCPSSQAAQASQPLLALRLAAARQPQHLCARPRLQLELKLARGPAQKKGRAQRLVSYQDTLLPCVLRPHTLDYNSIVRYCLLIKVAGLMSAHAHAPVPRAAYHGALHQELTLRHKKTAMQRKSEEINEPHDTRREVK